MVHWCFVHLFRIIEWMYSPHVAVAPRHRFLLERMCFLLSRLPQRLKWITLAKAQKAIWISILVHYISNFEFICCPCDVGLVIFPVFPWHILSGVEYKQWCSFVRCLMNWIRIWFVIFRTPKLKRGDFGLFSTLVELLNWFWVVK